MTHYYGFFLVVGLIITTKCERERAPTLKILKSFGDNYTPVQSSIVEEKVGANFSLLCDLVSSVNNTYYDWQISWVKQTNDLRFWKEHDLEELGTKKSKKIYKILTPSDINKAVKRFQPLKPDDKGNYFCVSLKYNLYKAVEVVVRDDKPYFEDRPVHETIFCSEQMFQCVSNGVCIIHHYICDGKADCKDGSDESEETCNGDPCKDKLHCDDGRCIPTSWCCDRHHDPNCTVTNRPKCCQILSDSYEELEYGPPHFTQAQYNGARYVFISVCILSISFFIVLLLLILSKVMIFAKKSALQHGRNNPNIANIENIALRSPYQFQARMVDNCDVSDPLLFTNFGRRDEQPPPYIDVVRAQNCRLNLNEPPPPYTSREVLNIEDRN